MNNVVVTVLYLLRAYHRRIIVYRALSKIKNLDDTHFKFNDIARPIYVNKTSDCLFSRLQRLIGLKTLCEFATHVRLTVLVM